MIKKQNNQTVNDLMLTLKDKMNRNIIHNYSPGTKIKYLEKTTRLNQEELAFVLSDNYHHDLLDQIKRVIPVEYQLLYIYDYFTNLVRLEVNKDFLHLLKTYHIDKDDKYFTWWCEEYLKDEDDFVYEIEYKIDYVEREETEDINIDTEMYKALSSKELTFPKPGAVEYNIGHYSETREKPIRIDDMIITNWRYSYYIISKFDNSPFQHLFYYIYMKLKERQEQGFIDEKVNINTMIPLNELKEQYEQTFGEYKE